MIKLSIPFTRDNLILSLVKEEHLKYVEEVYMPLPASVLESCRLTSSDIEEKYESVFEEQIKKAKEMGLKVSLIANKQFIEASKLRSTSMKIVKLLERLKKECDIDKVVLSNLYIVRQYGEYLKELGIDVEISVVVNANTPDAVDQLVNSLGNCFTGICLGDAMIHNIDGLSYLKERYPHIKTKLIAAHGCLVNCVGSCQHHHYSCSSRRNCTTDPVAMSENHEMMLAEDLTATCHAYSFDKGKSFGDSSFIRPEDVYVYEGMVDTLKISGRQHSAEYIVNVVDAYCKRSYQGELRTLMDMNSNIQMCILNEQIPAEFGKKRSTCMHQCHKCNYCKIIYDFVKSHSTTEKFEV